MQSRFDNSMDLELLRSIEKGSVDLVLTDPPYLISKDSGMQRLKDSGKSHEKYGFKFDSQIGGLKQPNDYSSNWINFFRDQRLNIIFELIILFL